MQLLVEDLDGDRSAEVMLKTAPGSRTIMTDGTPRFITLFDADIAASFTHEDDYRLDAAGYRAHLAEMLAAWHSHPEVAFGRWPVTVEAALGGRATLRRPAVDG